MISDSLSDPLKGRPYNQRSSEIGISKVVQGPNKNRRDWLDHILQRIRSDFSMNNIFPKGEPSQLRLGHKLRTIIGANALQPQGSTATPLGSTVASKPALTEAVGRFGPGMPYKSNLSALRGRPSVLARKRRCAPAVI